MSEAIDRNRPESLKRLKTELALRFLPETSGGIGHYASALGYPNEETFLDSLKGKVVLNLGSGRGLFEKEIHLRGVDCTVISVEPKLSLKSYKHKAHAKTNEKLARYAPEPRPFWHELLDKITGKKKRSPLEEASGHYDDHAVAAMAHALPFKSQRFDMILDVSAVSHQSGRHESYGGSEEKPIFKLYLQEAMRVLKPGGRLMINDPTAYGWIEIGQEPEPSWKEEVLKELGLSYKIIWEPDTSIPLGVEVVKPF